MHCAMNKIPFITILLCLFQFQCMNAIADDYSLGEIEDTAPGTAVPAAVCPPGVSCKPGQGIMLPPELDWSKFVTPVKDQGRCGSCVVFATTAALESAILVQEKGIHDVSEQYGLSCLLPSTLCDTGMQIGDYFKLLNQKGATQELSQYPYIASFGDCGAITKFITEYNFPYKIATFQKVVISSVNNLKSALYEYGPLVAAFRVYPSFSNYKKGLYRPFAGEILRGGHAVLVVGYSDKIGGFLVKNSWGTSWGDKGFFWIAYDQVDGMSDFATRGDGVYAVVDASTPPLPPGPPPPTPQQITASFAAINGLLLNDDEEQKCTYALKPTTQSVASAGGTYQVSVSTGASCAWKAQPDASWISLSSTNGGTGNGTLSYKVAANTATSSRSGNLQLLSGANMVGSLNIKQDAGACSYTVSPTTQSVSASGGTYQVFVTTTSGCSWQATSNQSWLKITSGASGTSNGIITYSVPAATANTEQAAVISIASSTGVVNTVSVKQSPKPSIAFDTNTITVSAREGANGTTTSMNFTVRLSASPTSTVTVKYATADGTAKTSTSDYSPASGTLSFSPGVTTKTITVKVKGDSVREPDENFKINLSSPSSPYTLQNSTATGVIINDD